MTRWLSVGIFLALFFWGCASSGKVDPKEKTADQLMSEGMESFEKEYYDEASENFQKIKDRYPYSKFAVEAELKIADSLYKRRLYDEDFDAYGEFQRLHPKNQNTAYVIYQKGMIHFERVSTTDRDQSHTLQAKEEFERLVKNFPQDEHANRARWKIRECYLKLAGSELRVGHYYYKMKKYRAAMGRYRYILKQYPDLGQYHEALEFLSKCEEKLSKELEEQKDQEKSSWSGKLNPFSWWHKSKSSEKSKLPEGQEESSW
jgi:outer membrane protein assembly factor BamD